MAGRSRGPYSRDLGGAAPGLSRAGASRSGENVAVLPPPTALFALCGHHRAPQKSFQPDGRLCVTQSATRGPAPLVLVGSKGWLYESSVAAIEQHGLREQVIWLGGVPFGTLPALYNRAAVHVYPSLYEGFGLPPLEAMQCGMPCACTHSTISWAPGCGFTSTPMSSIMWSSSSSVSCCTVSSKP
ncbi:MAG: glycosyltransferase family 4 protein [Anaerolineae bacterium]|nr:glycosyltransferase family 4 protein [Anaerolineae bacterium]